MDHQQKMRISSERNRREEPGLALYWNLEIATEFLIYAVLIFTPWAFATTEDWAINSVNTCNYVLGGFLVAKRIICKAAGYHPLRWSDTESGGTLSKFVTRALAGLTAFLLGYIALSAWNARAEFMMEEMRFQYFEDSRQWLPRSYDKSSTWAAFRMYFAAACFFWAVRDWLITKSKAEAQMPGENVVFDRSPKVRVKGRQESHSRFPIRLSRLFWLLCINGTLVALEGTLQRLSGTHHLLWLVRPTFNEWGWAQFGPFNYRSNGAQYLNMIWPLSLAFWWFLNRERRTKFGQGPDLLLLLFTGIMLAAPIIANSRGGVAVARAQVFAAIGLFAVSFRRSGWRKTAVVACIFMLVVGLTAWMQWKALQDRLRENTFNTLNGRTEIYENSERIAHDFPLWGSGAGTFLAMYNLYRANPSQRWFAQAHNDYLETRVTLGAIGFFAVLACVILVFAHPLAGRGIPVSGHFIQFLWTAAGGCLLHAKFDFPFQIYSLLLLFLTLCAILMVVNIRQK
jgi:O-antigen ligase